MSTKSLNDEEKDLLLKCLKKHAPGLISRYHQLESGLLNSDNINDIREAVGQELAAKGFRSDWEPNDYGFKLEELISRLADLYLWPDKNGK